MKKIYKYFLLLVIMFPSLINALEYPQFESENVIVYDITDDKVLYELDSDDKTSVASLTKIMTTIVAIENIEDLDERVTITNKMISGVPWDASVIGLKAGDALTYRDLLYATLLSSGADAADSLAFLISGSVDEFVSLMNEKAKELGMNTTHFENTTGLDDVNHYSSAKDISILLKYALENDTFKDIFTESAYVLTNDLKASATIKYYNKNMKLDISKILGSKTGFTDDAGYCLGVYFKSSDHELLAITLNASYENGKYNNLVDVVDIIDFVDENYSNHTILTSKDSFYKIPVKFGNIDEYNITTNGDIILFLENDFDEEKIDIKYEGLEEVSYKNKVDSKLGNVKVYYDDVLLHEEEVFLKEEIKINIFKILWEYKFYILGGILLIVLIKKSFKKKKRKRTR